MADMNFIAEKTRAARAELAADGEYEKTVGTTVVTSVDGLTCEIEQGPWKFLADLPVNDGGGNRGPDPGVLIRGALGACLTMDCVTEAALQGLHLKGVSVEVTTELDARGMNGLAEVAPGYQKVFIAVHLDSVAREEELQALVEMVLERNPRYYDLTHALPVETQLRIHSTPMHAAAAA
jgi:uncharacterized OsmC-like protein